MSFGEFLTNMSIILAVMAIGALIEVAVPMFVAKPWRDRRNANLGLTAVSFMSNWVLASVAALAAVRFRPTGLLAALDWPLWAQTVIGIVVLDFSVGYLSHRTMHLWPFMWRFHQIHHSDPFVDVTTTYRTHPVETVWRFLFALVPVWALGLPAQAVVIQRLLQATNGVLEHANVRLWPWLDRALSLVWVTPNVHKIHHSQRVAEANSNYANLLTVYDRALGTYTPAERATSVVYGLHNVDQVQASTVRGLLLMPFQPEREPRSSDRAERQADRPVRAARV